ncbi:MAG: hypothetical protein IT381_25190 [Deltaproteobacteria bacterium]|nr:hypothetical protein [Deltaproteobacteria bacterium]
MIEAATVDCYNESEQATGWLTMLEEHLALPFETTVLGVRVVVKKLDLDPRDNIVAICVRGRAKQAVPLLELPLPRPAPHGASWIEAYRRFCGDR